MAVINLVPAIRSAAPVSKITKDFSYLKFNVSDFGSAENGNIGIPVQAVFDYLKFKVSDYIETENETDALPENSDLDYLKFDIQKYVQNGSVSENNELPEE